METILTIYHAFLGMNLSVLKDPSILWILYIMLFIILLLENGVLPAAFLPGDSLLFLTGVFISEDVFHFGLINLVLIAGAAIGTWLGYIQGLWLGNTKMVQGWLAHLPARYHDKAKILFHKYGLQALFIGRFIAFVRTLLPIMAGLSGLHSKRFHIFNWISATLWIFFITGLGYLFGLSPLFKAYKEQFMLILMLIPVILIGIGIVASLILVIKRAINKKKKSANLSKKASSNE